MNKELTISRLKHLIKVVKAVPKKNFDITDWSQSKEELPTTEKPTPCGTVACVLGWAGIDPEFRKQGLRTPVNSFYNSIIGKTVRYYSGAPRYRNTAGDWAAERFFGITAKQAKWIFMPFTEQGNVKRGQKSLESAVERIKDVIKEVRKGVA